jgi:hypothetical protein
MNQDQTFSRRLIITIIFALFSRYLHIDEPGSDLAPEDYY